MEPKIIDERVWNNLPDDAKKVFLANNFSPIHTFRKKKWIDSDLWDQLPKDAQAALRYHNYAPGLSSHFTKIMGCFIDTENPICNNEQDYCITIR